MSKPPKRPKNSVATRKPVRLQRIEAPPEPERRQVTIVRTSHTVWKPHLVILATGTAVSTILLALAKLLA